MGFLQRLLSRWKKKEAAEEIPQQEERKSFFLYIVMIPQIVTYFRRERQIARRNLELVLIDNKERPAYQIQQIAELLMSDLKLLYIVTERTEAFEELTEKAMEEYGLLLVIMEKTEGDVMPGNLVLNLNDWEKHLDIMNTVGYNTLIV